jgi:hypothetical protein
MYYVLLLLLAFLVPDIRAQQLVANYPFNGKASDVTAYANHASVHGANLTQDRFGVANRHFGLMAYKLVSPRQMHHNSILPLHRSVFGCALMNCRHRERYT